MRFDDRGAEGRLAEIVLDESQHLRCFGAYLSTYASLQGLKGSLDNADGRKWRHRRCDIV